MTLSFQVFGNVDDVTKNSENIISIVCKVLKVSKDHVKGNVKRGKRNTTGKRLLLQESVVDVELIIRLLEKEFVVMLDVWTNTALVLKATLLDDLGLEVVPGSMDIGITPSVIPQSSNSDVVFILMMALVLPIGIVLVIGVVMLAYTKTLNRGSRCQTVIIVSNNIGPGGDISRTS